MTSQPDHESFRDRFPWTTLRDHLSPAEAQPLALVLAAAGISSLVTPSGEGIALLVAAEDVERGRSELALYESENNRPRRSHGQHQPISQGITGVLVACLALVFLDWAANRDAFSVDWLAAGQAKAGLIVGGEWQRALTSLGLHAGFDHLASNLVIGGLFGLLLAQLVGSGLAWLTILLAGGLGNAVNALIQSPAHAAIGASTAVFGALGALATLMLSRARSEWSAGPRRWMPLGGGVMLLALLGVGDETARIDVGGHFAGFAAGCVLGAGLALGRTRIPRGGRAQFAYSAAAIFIFVGAWALAIAGSLHLL